MAKKLRKGKKKWFSVVAPPEFKSVKIGETLAYNESELIGRGITVGLTNISGDSKKQNLEVSLKIKGVEGNSARTEVMGYSLVKSYVKRLARKDSDKISETYKVTLKDNTNLVIKAIFVTKNKVSNSILTALRKNSDEFLKDYCKKNDFNKVMVAVSRNFLQKELQKKLSKTYPLVICQFRIVKKV